MAIVAENATWEASVYELELTDPVEGGPAGKSNRAAQQLANRTAWLRENMATLSEAELVEGAWVFGGAHVAAAGVARGTSFTPTLEAGANNDVLTAVHIFPTFTPGAFIGVVTRALHVRGGSSVFDEGVALGNTLTVAGTATLTRLVVDDAADPYVKLRRSGSLEYTVVTGGDDVLVFRGGSTQIERGRMTGGVFAWGTTVTGGAAAGDIVIQRMKGLRSSRQDGVNSAQLISLDGYDIVRVADGSNFVRIPYLAAASLAVAHANFNGGLVVADNDRVYYYSNGRRYYLTGTQG